MSEPDQIVEMPTTGSMSIPKGRDGKPVSRSVYITLHGLVVTIPQLATFTAKLKEAKIPIYLSYMRSEKDIDSDEYETTLVFTAKEGRPDPDTRYHQEIIDAFKAAGIEVHLPPHQQ